MELRPGIYNRLDIINHISYFLSPNSYIILDYNKKQPLATKTFYIRNFQNSIIDKIVKFDNLALIQHFRCNKKMIFNHEFINCSKTSEQYFKVTFKDEHMLLIYN